MSRVRWLWMGGRGIVLPAPPRHHDFDDCDDHITNSSRGTLILQDMQAVGVKEGEGGGQEGILIVLLVWSRAIL